MIWGSGQLLSVPTNLGMFTNKSSGAHGGCAGWRGVALKARRKWQEWDKALGGVQGLSAMNAVVVDVCPAALLAKRFQSKGACLWDVLVHKMHGCCKTEVLGMFSGGLAGD